jgi:uncharacterized membrane protein
MEPLAGSFDEQLFDCRFQIGIGWIISWLVGFLAFIIWILLMVKAYQRQMYKLPVIGDLADKWSK